MELHEQLQKSELSHPGPSESGTSSIQPPAAAQQAELIRVPPPQHKTETSRQALSFGKALPSSFRPENLVRHFAQRFLTMEGKEPETLIELAAHCLLGNEPATIDALGEIPRELYMPLFKAALRGGHTKTLTAMVKFWPFLCLHIGKLSVPEPRCDVLKAMIDGLQVFSAQNFDSRRPKLRILDLRQDVGCRTTCPEMITRASKCFHSCAFSEHSILKVEAQHSIATSETETQSVRQGMELLVDLSLDGSLKKNDFNTLLFSKVQQSLGLLHLCCRDLKIDTPSYYKSTVEFLDLVCIDHLAVEHASLSEVTTLLSEMVQLYSLSLSKITCKSLKGKIFRTFIMHLARMNHLKEFNFSSTCLTNKLANIIRGLPPDLDFLYLTFCELSHKDFKILSQSPHAKHLKLLNLSNNPMYFEDFEPLKTLLENLSGTLQHLEINHCLLTDSTITDLLPALSHCTQLRHFSFTSNPITTSMVIMILKKLTPLMELKDVYYPIPIDCYYGWYFQGHIDQQKLGDLHSQVKTVLKVAGREDMKCVTYIDNSHEPIPFQH
uniref:melanoma antigen preferentially expressed in tumors-like n=1 Tax=Jaculus jaculus TaxID=51337 RepID=UPI001E1B17EA|nr:melanoma antigen preferentially expressed in tumors-like [Jaculus jaculus]